jgi:peptidoglycan/LPS O-acetylase OafA/YrhL
MVAAVAVLGAMYAAADLLLDVLPARVYGWMVYISPVFRVGEFLFGMLLAVAMRRGWRSPIGVIPAAMLVGAWFHLYYRIRPDLASGPQLVVAHLDYPALALAYGLVIAAAARLDVEGRASLLRSRVMVLLGQWSYALYLVHATIIYALIELIGVRSGVVWTNTWWLAFITIVSTAVSAGLYHVFEHPVEQWLRRIQKAWLTRRMLRARPVPGPA